MGKIDVPHLNIHADAAGKKAPTDLRGKVFFHPGTGSLYKVTGHSFDAERERWMVNYVRTNADGDVFDQTYTHLPEDFRREGRFLEVKQ